MLELLLGYEALAEETQGKQSATNQRQGDRLGNGTAASRRSDQSGVAVGDYIGHENRAIIRGRKTRIVKAGLGQAGSSYPKIQWRERRATAAASASTVETILHFAAESIARQGSGSGAYQTPAGRKVRNSNGGVANQVKEEAAVSGAGSARSSANEPKASCHANVHNVSAVLRNADGIRKRQTTACAVVIRKRVNGGSAGRNGRQCAYHSQSR